jgi:Flp pilus assembly protein TadD
MDADENMIELADAGELRGDALEAQRYNTLAITQASQGMTQGALASFSKAIEFDPQNAGYYYNRGIVYAEEGAY